MATVIDATVSGVNSNCYVTLARGSQLVDQLPHAVDWFSDDNTNEPQLLVHATTLIDRLWIFEGSRAVTGQRLMWPRSGVLHEDTGEALSSGVIPEFVEMATAEWAYALYVEAEQDVSLAPGLLSIRTPSYSAEFGGPGRVVVPQAVRDLLGGYGRRKSSNMQRLIRA